MTRSFGLQSKWHSKVKSLGLNLIIGNITAIIKQRIAFKSAITSPTANKCLTSAKHGSKSTARMKFPRTTTLSRTIVKMTIVEALLFSRATQGVMNLTTFSQPTTIRKREAARSTRIKLATTWIQSRQTKTDLLKVTVRQILSPTISRLTPSKIHLSE
jgi:hypothetical protein